jgi:glycosyltransferase involved in cell wall biosynthesis
MRKKILFFMAPSIFCVGGVEIKTFFLSYYLKSFGYDVCVVTEKHELQKTFKGFRGKHVNFEIKTIEPFNAPRSSIKYLFSWSYRKKHYYSELSKLNLDDYDLFMSNHGIGICFFNSRGKKTVFIVELFSLMLRALLKNPKLSMDYVKLVCDYFVRKQIDTRALKNADIVVAETKTHAKLINSLVYRPDIKIIPNGVCQKSDSCKRNKNATQITCITASRLVEQKNNIALIDTFSKTKNNNAILIILGDGPEYTMLKEEVKKRKQEGRIFFKGLTENVREHFEAADIFLYASKMDSFGIVILEAMSAGIPVAMIDYKYNCGKDLIIDGVNGIIAKEGEFSGRLDKLFEDREEIGRLGLNAKRTAENLTWENVAGELARVIEEA